MYMYMCRLLGYIICSTQTLPRLKKIPHTHKLGIPKFLTIESNILEMHLQNKCLCYENILYVFLTLTFFTFKKRKRKQETEGLGFRVIYICGRYSDADIHTIPFQFGREKMWASPSH